MRLTLTKKLGELDKTELEVSSSWVCTIELTAGDCDVAAKELSNQGLKHRRIQAMGRASDIIRSIQQTVSAIESAYEREQSERGKLEEKEL